jgi:hypothetical protein
VEDGGIVRPRVIKPPIGAPAEIYERLHRATIEVAQWCVGGEVRAEVYAQCLWLGDHVDVTIAVGLWEFLDCSYTQGNGLAAMPPSRGRGRALLARN